MTSYHFEIDGYPVYVPVEAVETIEANYNTYNSFFTTETLISDILPNSSTELAPSINYVDFIKDEDEMPDEVVDTNGTTRKINMELLLRSICKSAIRGTIISCMGEPIHIHCGVKHNRLYTRIVSDPLNTQLESMFHHDGKLGAFIVNHCDKETSVYRTAIHTAFQMQQL